VEVDISCNGNTTTSKASFYMIRECDCQACNGAYILNEMVVIFNDYVGHLQTTFLR